MDAVTTSLLTEDIFGLVRAIGFVFLGMLIAIAFIFVRGHRWVFMAMILWMAMIVLSIGARELPNPALYRVVLNCLVTPTELLTVGAVAVRLWEYLRKLDRNE